jgi:hypothetical protein
VAARSEAERPGAPSLAGAALRSDGAGRDGTGDRWPLVLAIALIGSQVPWIRYGPLAALVIALITFRGWWRVLGLVRFGRACVFLVMAALASGVLLVLLAPDPYLVTSREATFTLLFIASQAAAALVAAYARIRLGLSLTLGAYAAGAALQGVYLAPTVENPWKFYLGLPVGVLLVLFVSQVLGRLATIVTLLGLAAVSGANDARSLAAFFALSAIVSAPALYRGTASEQPPTRRQSYLRRSVLMVSLGYGLYQAGVRIALSGGLGPGIEERTAEQLAVAGSVIEGGRPEWAATSALFADDPLGIGPGVRLTLSQLAVAENALLQRGVASGGAYVNEYLFTTSVRLHAIIADLWVNTGLMGVLLGAVMLVLLGKELLISTAVTSRATPAFTVLLIAGLWYMLFGPMLSNLPGVAFTVGVAAGSSALSRIRPGPDS